MRKTAAMLWLLASCTTTSEAESVARESFEKWSQAVAGGDATTMVSLMSVPYRSEWLYGLLKNQDPIARVWRETLTGTPRTDLDLWMYTNESRRSDERVVGLPPSVLADPTLQDMLRRCLETSPEKSLLADLEVVNVVVEGANATVLVKAKSRTTSYFAMVVEAGSWKVDGYVRPRPTVLER